LKDILKDFLKDSFRVFFFIYVLIDSRLRGGSRYFPGLPPEDPKSPIANVVASTPILTRSIDGHLLISEPNL